MKPYYCVYRNDGGLIKHKHENLEDAVKERLASIYPKETYQIMQCVAITSASKPVISTFYMDGVNTREPKPKTAREYLETLPEPYRTYAFEAIAEQSNDCWLDGCRESLVNSLSSNFAWRESRQGHDFWEKVHNCLSDNKPLPKL